jgi:hypothetical protein
MFAVERDHQNKRRYRRIYVGGRLNEAARARKDIEKIWREIVIILDRCWWHELKSCRGRFEFHSWYGMK